MWPHDSNCIGIRICILSPSVTWDQNWAGRQSVGDGSHYFRSISRLFTREDLRKGPLSNSPTQGNVTLAVDKVSQRKLQTTYHDEDFKNFLWTDWEMIRCTHDLSLGIAHQEKLWSCFYRTRSMSTLVTHSVTNRLLFCALDWCDSCFWGKLLNASWRSYLDNIGKLQWWFQG